MTDFKPRHPTLENRCAARLAIGAASLLLAAGCTVGPDYKRPDVATPAAFKEDPGWKAAAPGDNAARGPWWEVFEDPVLNELEARVETSNLTVAQAVANYEEARQVARADRTAYLPTVSATGAARRTRPTWRPPGSRRRGRSPWTTSSSGRRTTRSGCSRTRSRPTGTP